MSREKESFLFVVIKKEQGISILEELKKELSIESVPSIDFGTIYILTFYESAYGKRKINNSGKFFVNSRIAMKCDCLLIDEKGLI